MDLEIVLKAVESASIQDAMDDADAAIRAASAMPPDASDFDRGIAAGIALTHYLNQAKRIQAAA